MSHDGTESQHSPSSFSVEAFHLRGLTAVVTGAAQGLGEAIACAFSNMGAGLALCDKRGEQLEKVGERLRQSGSHVTTADLDVRDAPAVQSWVESLADEFPDGRIDVVVNNAGGTFHGAFLDLSERARQALIDENFNSVAIMVEACTPMMLKGGSIINITSVEAFKASPGFAIYGAMKAAVEHLTRSLALELSDRGIRVNSIAPDALKTPGDADLLLGDDDYGAKLALGWGLPDDICGAAVFLASPASRFITGTTIHVDGGSDAARGWRKTVHGWMP